MKQSHTGRIEIKYIVNEKLAAEVLRTARQYLRPDRGLTEPQRVTSLYLDSPNFTFLQWHQQARRHRFKLRVRGYGDTPSCLFAEIKQRIGELGRKRRAEFSTDVLELVLGGGDGKVRASVGDRFPDLTEFIQKRHAFRAEPKVLVSCYRQSLREEGSSGETAVTIDHRIASRPASSWDLPRTTNGWQPIVLPGRDPSETAVVELKYSQEAPAWMKSLMIDLAPHRVGFSKYRAAVQPAYWNCVACSSE
jgi:VTC domain-containing protein